MAGAVAATRVTGVAVEGPAGAKLEILATEELERLATEELGVEPEAAPDDAVGAVPAWSRPSIKLRRAWRT